MYLGDKNLLRRENSDSKSQNLSHQFSLEDLLILFIFLTVYMQFFTNDNVTAHLSCIIENPRHQLSPNTQACFTLKHKRKKGSVSALRVSGQISR